MKYLKLGYHHFVSNFIYLLLIIPTIFISSSSSNFKLDQDFFTTFHQLPITATAAGKLFNNVALIAITVFITGLINFLITFYIMKRPRKVYLVDFSCYIPTGSELKSSTEFLLKRSKQVGTFTDESIAFQEKILVRSGLGDDTYSAPALIQFPPNPSMAESRKEVEMVLFGAIDGLLKKTGVNVKEIGILVVNCSLFCPTPSLSAMIVNHYKLRGNILSYNLGGMGCSAGLISIDLAKQLLQVNPKSYALVASMESLTQNCYFGNYKPMLVTNCLFRLGGAAILLSNKPSERRRSKYQLLHTVRTHMGSDDKSYNCVFQREDREKLIGVALSKDLMTVAGEALKTNITTLGPLVLPVSEQLLFIGTLIARKLLSYNNKLIRIKPYIPDFKLAFEHFCIHAGGKSVLDEIQKSLNLSDWDMEPSRMTLYRFGNTSSSSLWYELAYSEAKRRIKKGDRIWQIGFGSGFKCNSAVWKALKNINPADERVKNPWMDDIDDFPVELPTTVF